MGINNTNHYFLMLRTHDRYCSKMSRKVRHSYFKQQLSKLLKAVQIIIVNFYQNVIDNISMFIFITQV